VAADKTVFTIALDGGEIWMGSVTGAMPVNVGRVMTFEVQPDDLMVYPDTSV
jgi:hypothetical protein